MAENRVENLIVLGGGPAGYTAALYASRANLEPLVIEGFQWGGQLQNTTDVENYPGYPEGIMGPEMMNEFRAQAERFGTRFVTDDADRVELTDGDIQRVFIGDQEHAAKSIVLAMGAEPRRLGIPGEMELAGRGVSTCGVCDGAFFKGQKVAVIGGGDSAMEDSIFISKYASDLDVVHRRDEFRVEDHAGPARRSSPTSASRPRTCRRSSSPATTASCARSGSAGPTTAPRRSSRWAAHSSRSATSRALSWWPSRSTSTTRATCPTAARRARTSGGVRGRRPRRPHLPPGGHRRGHRLHGGAGRRVVSARHAAVARGPLAARRRAGRGGAAARGERRVGVRAAGARERAHSELARTQAQAHPAHVVVLAELVDQIVRIGVRAEAVPASRQPVDPKLLAGQGERVEVRPAAEIP